MYFFINFIISTDIFLIISFFFSMFIFTIIVVVAFIVLISLFYLYSDKIRKKCREAVKIIT